MITRRTFTGGLGALSAFYSLGLPSVSFASLPTDKRFVFIILRGGMDGLAAVPPYDDNNYETIRESLALPSPGEGDGIIDLDGFFGLHPALEDLKSLYDKKELAIFHAVASPYRNRSHFDGQNVVENGTGRPNGANDGWLNRALSLMPGASGENALGIAISQQVPLILQGQQQVTSWAPMPANIKTHDGFLEKMGQLYSNDKKLGRSFSEGLRTKQMVESSMPKDDQLAGRGAMKAEHMSKLTRAVATLLTDENGPRIAVMETSGWDTHANQGSVQGQLANRLEGLAKGLVTLKQGMGKSWKDTVVVVVTEFGRTVKMNGTGGTDHGTAGVSLVLGGAVKGGQVLGKWPGLRTSQLYEGRDLMPTTDMRSIFKTVLVRHLGLNNSAVDASVFPGSGNASIIHDLIT